MNTTREPFYVDIGTRLRQARMARGWTQAQLAKQVDPVLSRPAIANIECGNQRVYVHALERIARVLDVQTATLFGERPAPTSLSEVLEENERLKKALRDVRTLCNATRHESTTARKALKMINGVLG